jgi:pyrophosphatase PpaX
MLSSITTVFFDWDGTLVDSAECGYRAFEATFAEFGVRFNRDEFDRCYSPNWYEMYQELGLPRETWTLADERWVDHYAVEKPALVIGADAAVRALAAAGLTLGIVSGGNRVRVHRELTEHGIASLFRVVVAGEDTVRKKPDPEGLTLAMRVCGATATQSLFVGDAAEDILMGRAVGAMTVAVRSAYPTYDSLRAAKPDLWLESIAEICDLFPPLVSIS